MFFKKPKKILKETDEIFLKLLNVIPNSLTRERTQDYLGDYIFVSEGDVFNKGFAEFESDYYHIGGFVPSPSIRVQYDTNSPFMSVIYLVYPLNIVQFLVKIHRIQIFKKLDKLLDSRFGRASNQKGLIYWQKGLTFLHKNLYEEKGGYLGIKIISYNTSMTPIERIFEDFENGQGLFKK